MQAPDTPTIVEIGFEKGDPVSIDGVKMSPATILTKCAPPTTPTVAALLRVVVEQRNIYTPRLVSTLTLVDSRCSQAE
jgi:hypothetical protein